MYGEYTPLPLINRKFKKKKLKKLGEGDFSYIEEHRYTSLILINKNKKHLLYRQKN